MAVQESPSLIHRRIQIPAILYQAMIRAYLRWLKKIILTRACPVGASSVAESMDGMEPPTPVTRVAPGINHQLRPRQDRKCFTPWADLFLDRQVAPGSMPRSFHKQGFFALHCQPRLKRVARRPFPSRGRGLRLRFTACLSPLIRYPIPIATKNTSASTKPM